MSATTTYFNSETEAIAYLTQRFTDDSPAEIATYVTAIETDLINQGENPDLWWDGITGDELVEWVFDLF